MSGLLGRKRISCFVSIFICSICFASHFALKRWQGLGSGSFIGGVSGRLGFLFHFIVYFLAFV